MYLSSRLYQIVLPASRCSREATKRKWSFAQRVQNQLLDFSLHAQDATTRLWLLCSRTYEKKFSAKTRDSVFAFKFDLFFKCSKRNSLNFAANKPQFLGSLLVDIDTSLTVTFFFMKQVVLKSTKLVLSCIKFYYI